MKPILDSFQSGLTAGFDTPGSPEATQPDSEWSETERGAETRSIAMKDRLIWIPAVAILTSPFFVAAGRWCLSGLGSAGSIAQLLV